MREQTVHLTIPKTLSFENNHQETVSFFDSLRGLTEDRAVRLTIDFTQLRNIGAAAALVLAAELECWRMNQLRRIRIVDIHDWDPFILHLLTTLGLFSLVRVSNPPPPPLKIPQFHFIRFQSHHLADGDLALPLRAALEQITGEIPRWKDLYRGLSEAMTNVRQHAYPETHGFIPDDPKNRWWMSGAYDADDKLLTCVFYDRGVGIPATVANTFGARAIQSLLERAGWSESDEALIMAAMELGRTRSRAPHKGRGLADVESYVKQSQSGMLRILSRGGQYIYSSDTGAANPSPLVSPIRGTLIEWSIRLHQ